MWFELLCLRESLKPKWRARSLPSSSSRIRSKASTSLDPPSSNHGVPMGCRDQGSTLPFMSTFKFVLFPPQRILLVLRLSLYVLCVNLPHLDGFIPLSVISATNTPHHQLWLQNRFRMWEIHTSEPTSWALSVFISLDLPLPWHSVHCDCYIQKRCVFSRQKKPSGGFAKD